MTMFGKKKESIDISRELKRVQGKVYGEKVATHESVETRRHRKRFIPNYTITGARRATNDPGEIMIINTPKARKEVPLLVAVLRLFPRWQSPDDN